MNRALVVHPGPQFSVSDVHRGWIKGLRQLGWWAEEYALNNRLYFFAEAKIERDGEHYNAFSFDEAARLAMKEVEAAYLEFWPQVVFIVSGFYLNEFVCQVLRDRGAKIVLIHTESPYEDGKQLRRAPWVDLNVLNDPTNIDTFKAEAPTIYLPHCYDPDLHHPADPTPGYESDLAFVGTGYPSRIEFLEAVDWSGIDVALGGNWQELTDESPLRPFLSHDIGDCLPNEDAVVHYQSTRASLNLYRAEAMHPQLVEGWSMGPREVELAATGCFFLREKRGEGDALLPMLPTFTEPAEFAEKLRWWLARDDEREAAALKAREAVADRTFDTNAATALQLLGF